MDRDYGSLSKQEYLEILDHSYAESQHRSEVSRAEFLSGSVFGFTTYCEEMDDLFVRYAVQVCDAIASGTTFDYIRDPDQYKWFVIMCNIPFFKDRIDWGTSIRGAWWTHEAKSLQSFDLYDDGEQILLIDFESDAWNEFVRAVIDFYRAEK